MFFPQLFLCLDFRFQILVHCSVYYIKLCRGNPIQDEPQRAIADDLDQVLNLKLEDAIPDTVRALEIS